MVACVILLGGSREELGLGVIQALEAGVHLALALVVAHVRRFVPNVELVCFIVCVGPHLSPLGGSQLSLLLCSRVFEVYALVDRLSTSMVQMLIRCVIK